MSTHGRWSTHLRNWVELVCSSWEKGTHLAPHDHGGASGLVFLLWGELHERRWKESGDQLVFMDRVVMRAPAIGVLDVTDIHDVVATRGSVAAHLYYPKPKEVRTFPYQRG